MSRRAFLIAAYGGGAATFDDIVSLAAAGYSTRKLRSAYAGSAIRVKRSSDNAEQDIGFSAGALDTAALTAFVGAGSATVVKWYDQVGSADLVASTTAPRIVNGGTIDTKNTKPVVYFDISNTHYYINTTGNVLGGATQYSMSIVALMDATWAPNYGRLLSFANAAAANDYTDSDGALAFYREASTNAISHDRPGILTDTVTASVVDQQLFYAIAFQDASTQNLLLDNVAATPKASTPPALASSIYMGVGGGAIGGGSPWTGSIGEILLWSSALSLAQRTTLYNNTKAYWGTP